MIIGGGRIRAQGSREELLTDAGTLVEAADLAALDDAMQRAGLATHPADGSRRLVDAEPAVVARAALDGGVVLHGLAPAGSAGLERLFFDLTATGGIHHDLSGAMA
jgi:ABC-2 type transport system ATP-binding protein